MRRLIVALILACGLLTPMTADAWWGRHCGWRGGCGWGGYRSCGWGGYRGCGYVGYGCYPSYGYGYGCSVGYAPGCYSYGYPAYGAYGFGVPAGYGYYGANLNTGTTLGVSPTIAARPVLAATPQQTLQNFLGLAGLRPISLLTAQNSRPAQREIRMSNPEARRSAERLIADGDDLFRGQNFHAALQRYKHAAAAAPDLAESYWRQGHAMISTRNFDLATNAFKRAIGLSSDLNRGGFHLSSLYGNATMTKTAHLESLAEWTLANANSADPYFLLGVFLKYDGQAENAEKFFARASDLAGPTAGHLAMFLAPQQPMPAPQAVADVPPPAPVPVSLVRARDI